MICEATLSQVNLNYIFYLNLRSSRPDVFCKKGVLRNFIKFAGKHLCQRLSFNKVAGPRPVTLLKKSLQHRYFPVDFMKFLRTSFYMEHLRWLLLNLFLFFCFTEFLLVIVINHNHFTDFIIAAIQRFSRHSANSRFSTNGFDLIIEKILPGFEGKKL